LQCVAVRCSVLQCVAVCCSFMIPIIHSHLSQGRVKNGRELCVCVCADAAATHCSTLQHTLNFTTATHWFHVVWNRIVCVCVCVCWCHCNTHTATELQHATHCSHRTFDTNLSNMQHTATHCNKRCNTAAVHCNTRCNTRCNALQHIHYNITATRNTLLSWHIWHEPV